MTRKVSPSEFCLDWCGLPLARLLRWIARGVVPRPVIVDATARWDESVIAEWEANGHPYSDRRGRRSCGKFVLRFWLRKSHTSSNSDEGTKTMSKRLKGLQSKRVQADCRTTTSVRGNVR